MGKYVVKSGSGGEKGVIDLTDKKCLSNMVKTWIFAEDSIYNTNGYIIFPNGRIVGSYNNTPVKISVKYNYPSDFNPCLDINTLDDKSTRVYGYRIGKGDITQDGPYSYFYNIFSQNFSYISEDVECEYPEIKKHFGYWHDYSNLRYIDVVKYPAQNNGNVFTDYIIMKQVYNSNTWLTTLALKNPSKVCINISNTAPKAKLQIVAEYICYYTHSVSDYDPSIQLNNEYTNNPDRSWYFTDVDAVLNGVAFTTCDILYEDDTIAIKANCTLDEVIQKE